ncbi:MAG TPA: pirin family protein [Anaerolineaceae bacterium]|nr:pirin family protein [Anaerolineaceae bacterium]
MRQVVEVIEPQWVREGAGVKLRRTLGSEKIDHLDPFLLLDHFGSNNPEDYLRGFPMHPHRGIETVTYMLAGLVRHKDSLGNKGEISSGDVQWMTAGRAILHEEMPEGLGGQMEGFQLWVNLPADLKMSPPRYQEIQAGRIPWLNPEKGVAIRLIAGRYGDAAGPVTEIAVDPLYMDVAVDSGDSFEYDLPEEHNAFLYVFRGGGDFCGLTTEATRLLILGQGGGVCVKAGLLGTRFLLVAGKPLNEPIVRYGPIVMNTVDEIKQTLREIRDGTFIQP